jgi:hypothetical protein
MTIRTVKEDSLLFEATSALTAESLAWYTHDQSHTPFDTRHPFRHSIRHSEEDGVAGTHGGVPAPPLAQKMDVRTPNWPYKKVVAKPTELFLYCQLIGWVQTWRSFIAVDSER